MKVLAVHHEDPSLIFRTNALKVRLVAHTCNPGTGEVETERSLGLSFHRQDVLWPVFSTPFEVFQSFSMDVSQFIVACSCLLFRSRISCEFGRRQPTKEEVLTIVVMINRDVCHQIHDVLPNGEKQYRYFLLTAVGPSRRSGETRLERNLSWQRSFLACIKPCIWSPPLHKPG